MSNNGDSKKHGIQHYLHRQWTATTLGREAHDKECKRQKSLKIKPKVMKVNSPG